MHISCLSMMIGKHSVIPEGHKDAAGDVLFPTHVFTLSSALGTRRECDSACIPPLIQYTSDPYDMRARCEKLTSEAPYLVPPNADSRRPRTLHLKRSLEAKYIREPTAVHTRFRAAHNRMKGSRFGRQKFRQSVRAGVLQVGGMRGLLQAVDVGSQPIRNLR